MDKYLLYILHEVNTIIIPGLGALTVTNKATGEIMFMSYLKHDDGNLAKHIAEKEGVAENDAKNLIAKYVREIQAKLDKGETYDMYQFGRFIKKDGEIDFENWNSYQHNPEDSYVESESQTDSSIASVPDTEVKTESPEEKITETPEEVLEAHVEEEIKAEELTEQKEIKSANEVIEDLIESSKPVEAPKSIDEILKTEEKTEEIIPIAIEIKKEKYRPENEIISEIILEESILETPEDKEVQAEKEEEAKPEIDTSQIKPSENVFIPKEELVEIAETQQKEKLKAETKPAPGVAKEKAVKTVTKEDKEPKNKKKTVLLIVLIFVVIAGSSVAIFYDKIEAALFSSEKTKKEETKTTSEDDKNLDEIEKQVALEQENSELPEGQQTETPETNTENTEAIEKTQKPDAVSKTTDGSLSYHIIAGSFGVEENANRLAKKYSDAGKNASVLGKFDNMYLVSYESFASKEEANAALKSGDVKGWVFKYPK